MRIRTKSASTREIKGCKTKTPLFGKDWGLHGQKTIPNAQTASRDHNQKNTPPPNLLFKKKWKPLHDFVKIHGKRWSFAALKKKPNSDRTILCVEKLLIPL